MRTEQVVCFECNNLQCPQNSQLIQVRHDNCFEHISLWFLGFYWCVHMLTYFTCSIMARTLITACKSTGVSDPKAKQPRFQLPGVAVRKFFPKWVE